MRSIVAAIALALLLLAGSAVGWARAVAGNGLRDVVIRLVGRLADAAGPLGARPVFDYVALELHAAAEHLADTDIGSFVWTAPEDDARS